MNEKQTMKGNLKISCFDSFPFSELKPILEFITSRGYEIQFVDNGNIVCQKIEQDASSTLCVNCNHEEDEHELTHFKDKPSKRTFCNQNNCKCGEFKGK